MLVNMKRMLEHASQNRYAVGAFNCATLESAQAAIRAAEELNMPVILQHAQAHEKYISIEMAAAIMLTLAKQASVPVCVHLDHGGSMEYVARALRLGFTSVMYDASSASLARNTEETRMIVRLAHSVDVTVEAELGSLPHNFTGELSDYCPEDFYTVPEEAARFAADTGVDALAVSFGTVHGLYKSSPKLSFDIPRRIHQLTGGLPLVMHGGSGLSADDYRRAIDAGVCKINYYTYEALAGGRGAYQAVAAQPEGLQFHDVAMTATEWMKQNVKQVLRIFAGDRP